MTGHNSYKSSTDSAAGQVGAQMADGSHSYQPNELLTVADVCQQYGIGRTSLYAALASGQLTARVLGKRGTRIRRQDIDAFVVGLKPYRPLVERE